MIIPIQNGNISPFGNKWRLLVNIRALTVIEGQKWGAVYDIINTI